MTDVYDKLSPDSFSEAVRSSLSAGKTTAGNQPSMWQPGAWTRFRSREGRVAVTSVTFGQQDGGDSRPAFKRPAGGEAFARTFDIVVALVLIACLLPVLVAVGLLVFLTEPGPVLFSHTRKGKGGNSFKCLKFRSMVLDADVRLQELLARDPLARAAWDRDHKLRVDPRITRIGAFLRRSSLDELPQLFNVLRGDMSLVGPRPIVEAEVPRYGRYITHYYRVRPGVTGLWQVSGRNNTTYRRRVALDVMYMRRKSAKLNLHILIMTLPSVFASKGAF